MSIFHSIPGKNVINIRQLHYIHRVYVELQTQ